MKKMDYKKLMMYGTIAAAGYLSQACGDDKIRLKAKVSTEFGANYDSRTGEGSYRLELLSFRKGKDGKMRYETIPIKFNKFAEPLSKFIRTGDSVEVMMPRDYNKILEDLVAGGVEYLKKNNLPEDTHITPYIDLEGKDLVRVNDMRDKVLHYQLGIY
jgi:hypothetical protein